MDENTTTTLNIEEVDLLDTLPEEKLQELEAANPDNDVITLPPVG